MNSTLFIAGSFTSFLFLSEFTSIPTEFYPNGIIFMLQSLFFDPISLQQKYVCKTDLKKFPMTI